MLLEKIGELLDNQPAPAPNIIFAGDLNLPHTAWPACSPKAGASPDERKMIDSLSILCSQHFLYQLVDQPTHRAGNILDLILTNNPEIFRSTEYIPASPISSHSVVLVQSLLTSPGTTINCNPRDLTKFDEVNLRSEKTDWDTIRNTLAAVDWHHQFENLSTTQMIDSLTDLCAETAIGHAPKRRQKVKTRIPRDRRILMRKRCKLRKRLQHVRNQARRIAIEEQLTEIERRLQDSYRLQDEREEERAVDAIKRNPKYFYSFATRHKIHCPVGPLLDVDGQQVSDPEKMAQILANQYKEAFSNPGQSSLNTSVTPDIHIDDIDITEEDLIVAIDEISSNAAPGPDRFPAVMLKECKKQLSKPLQIIWRKSLDTGEIPSNLKISNITPVHKGGDKHTPKNYRPVALTSHLIKIFEKVIRKHLVKFIEGNNLLNPNQHGFRAGHSCLSQLLQHFDRITKLIEEGKNVDIIYLDFSKAFDKLDFQITLQKMLNMGITGKLLRWMESFLTDRKQCVALGGFKSKLDPVLSGVPQGSVVGPLLYLIMMGDIDENVRTAHVSSFADDTRVLAGISHPGDVDALQQDLGRIYQWSSDNNAVFNADKFECLRYGTNKAIIENTAYYSNNLATIKTHSSVKDLGVTMSSDATFAEHIFNVIGSANLKCAWVLRSFKTRDRTALVTLWKALVMPTLDYCSQLWCPNSPGLIQAVEKVQLNFLRKISGMGGLDYWDQLKSLNLYSLQRRRERYICIYVWKILEGIVPNFGVEVVCNKRTGRYCKVPHIRTTAPCRIRTIRYNSMGVNGPRVFNSLPLILRNTSGCSVGSFKRALDKHLSAVPDEPRVPGLIKHCSRGSNSLIIDQ